MNNLMPYVSMKLFKRMSLERASDWEPWDVRIKKALDKKHRSDNFDLLIAIILGLVVPLSLANLIIILLEAL